MLLMLLLRQGVVGRALRHHHRGLCGHTLVALVTDRGMGWICRRRRLAGHGLVGRVLRLVVHGLLHLLGRGLPVDAAVLVVFMVGGRRNLCWRVRLRSVILHGRVGVPRHLLRCGHHFGCFWFCQLGSLAPEAVAAVMWNREVASTRIQ